MTPSVAVVAVAVVLIIVVVAVVLFVPDAVVVAVAAAVALFVPDAAVVHETVVDVAALAVRALFAVVVIFAPLKVGCHQHHH